MPSLSYVEEIFTANDVIRFWSKVDIRGDDDCWIWLGSRGGMGDYGIFRLRSFMIGAHRFSTLLAHGLPPNESDDACHDCDLPACVNPKHLCWGTRHANIQDSIAKGRFTSRGPRINPALNREGQPLTDDEVRAIFWSRDNADSTGRDYGVSGATVRQIRRRDTHKALDMGPCPYITA